jgi:hypothetical protein
VDEGHDRPPISAVTRGSMLDAEMYPHLDLRLQIGICGAQRDGQEVLEVSFVRGGLMHRGHSNFLETQIQEPW